MDTEFHYWTTGLIAHRAGFSKKESEIIAYSSEYVDENDVSFQIKNKQKGGLYSNHISQTMNILKPKTELMRIYPVFHFIPGEPDASTAGRRDGKMHLLNTTPNSENANEIIDAAFKAPEDTRLYRIGIASHSYVDTWAHQNFVGWYDYFNNIGLDIKPDIGHADAEHHPDWMGHVWVDNRLVDGDVSNKLRFLSASKELFHKYCSYIKKRNNKDNCSEWEKLEKELIEMMGPTFTGGWNRHKDKRIAGYKNALDWLSDFDDRKWFDEAIKTKVRGKKDSHEGIRANFTLFQDEHYWRNELNKDETDWFKFQGAVREHEEFALKLLAPTFKKMGIDLSVA